MKYLILFVVLAAFEVKAETRYVHKDINKFLHALNMVEASGKSGNIIGDSGKALGGYQIWKSYYQDAVEKSKGKLNKPYSAVSDIKYAKEVVLWYFYRYAPKALENGDWIALSKLHHLGPNWKKREQRGNDYWLKVKKYLK